MLDFEHQQNKPGLRRDRLIVPSADYPVSQHHAAICRGRLIVPSADLSAFGGCSKYPA